MSDQLGVEVKCRVNWLLQETSALATVADAAQLEYAKHFEDGVGTDQADKLCCLVVARQEQPCRSIPIVFTTTKSEC